MAIFEAITNNIHVQVEPRYEEHKSRPEQGIFVFSYRVTISNNGEIPVQIHRRSWTICDAFNNIEYVEGEGVIGEMPVILPGEAYTYTSFCSLKTSFGTMKGFYTLVNNAGKTSKITIPEFILAHPYAIQ